MASIAVDTNVLVRLATGDSAAEHADAESLVASSPVFIPITVLLETEWALRSRYEYAPRQFLAFIHWLLVQPGIEFAEPKSLRAALDLHRGGFDFADALHVVSTGGRPFATFDRALLRRGRARGLSVHALGR